MSLMTRHLQALEVARGSLAEVEGELRRCNEQERDVQTSAQQARQRILSESADCAVLKAKINKASTKLAELKAVT